MTAPGSEAVCVFCEQDEQYTSCRMHHTTEGLTGSRKKTIWIAAIQTVATRHLTA
jgi:hypothetical protein